MVSRVSTADALTLSVAERILLVQDIWDSIASLPEAVPLTDAQRRELETRLQAYHQDPAAGSPWDLVKTRILHNK
jgi:putative addiction module component (TIGR02574 family)